MCSLSIIFSCPQFHVGSEQSVNENDNVIKEEDEEEGDKSPSKEPINVSSIGNMYLLSVVVEQYLHTSLSIHT